LAEEVVDKLFSLLLAGKSLMASLKHCKRLQK
jgi:hypothetical protein